MKKIFLKHVPCEYNCMWNGIEDIYRTKTNFDIPPYLFFGLSAFCNTIYLKNNKFDIPRTVYFSAGIAKKMYENMSDIIGFKFQIIEDRSFDSTFKILKKEIDLGYPVVIGAIDMYYLDYFPKFYNKIHIPIHYITIIGYNDKEEKIYLLENSREEIQNLSYDNLKLAWNIKVPGFSKKHTLYTFRFDDELKPRKYIFYEGLKRKCEFNLHTKLNFMGINSFLKLAKEIRSWESQLTFEKFKKCLEHIVEYTGFPPSLPVGDTANIIHSGARYEFAKLLEWGAIEYKDPELKKASICFNQSGKIIEDLSECLFNYLKNEEKNIDEAIDNMLLEIYEKEKEGYIIIEKSLILT